MPFLQLCSSVFLHIKTCISTNSKFFFCRHFCILACIFFSRFLQSTAFLQLNSALFLCSKMVHFSHYIHLFSSRLKLCISAIGLRSSFILKTTNVYSCRSNAFFLQTKALHFCMLAYIYPIFVYRLKSCISAAAFITFPSQLTCAFLYYSAD